ncbi:uncharacterized protein LOC127808607 [Diospyros lotus]|uniref:uncharacterized protein LOC127808607 n=1 Tax=Diospyros lotus TaxID=55363 RepID=UPI00225B827F|nr:uncharacterized protein LOC127808607 [Diospyros lotus]
MLQAIDIARLKDDQLRATRKAMAYKGLAMAGSSSGTPKPKPPLAPQPAASKHIPPGVKRLSWDEMQKRHEQGLCFNCNEKFTPGHKCKVAQSFLIEVKEPPEEEEYEESDPHVPFDIPAANSGVEAEDLPKVSLHALAGSAGPQTMQVTAMLKGKVASLLINNGSTHNFISTKVAHKLQIPTTIIEPFEVRVASGERLAGTQQCKAVSLKIQHIYVSVDLYVIPLAGVDIVLGVQWLAQLGKVVFDYKQMAMEFTLGGRQVRLSMQQGTTRAVEVYVVQKLVRAGSECYAIQIASQPRASENFQSTDVPQLPTDVQVVLAKFPTVVQEPTNLPPSRPFDHCIPLLDEQPINVAPYRYAYHQKEEIEKQVKEMLQKNLIRPSTSPFSSPVLLVEKKDGMWHFCTDYRALNKATVKDGFPIPAIDDMLDELAGSTIFTKLDLRTGYHQIRIHPGDIHKTAFRTHHGHYEYMTRDQHLEQVLSILARESFCIKLSKCAFGQTELEYLGHRICPEGVKHYGAIARPLTQLLKKDKFQWTNDADHAFATLKQAMTCTPVLAMPDFAQQIEVHTDTSNIGIGAVLVQQGRPVAFLSKALSPAKATWSAYAKEMLAIIEAVRRIVTPDQQKWVAKLMGYDYEIVYRPGAQNKVADALSRRDDSPQLLPITGPNWAIWQHIRDALVTDQCSQDLIEASKDSETVSDYEYCNGLLLY